MSSSPVGVGVGSTYIVAFPAGTFLRGSLRCCWRSTARDSGVWTQGSLVESSVRSKRWRSLSDNALQWARSARRSAGACDDSWASARLMTGISIGRAHDGPVVRRALGATAVMAPLGSQRPALELDQLTDFVEFFVAALPALRSLWWLLDRVSFSPPVLWDRQYDAAADRYTGRSGIRSSPRRSPLAAAFGWFAPGSSKHTPSTW
jgi:hypothetical protein